MTPATIVISDPAVLDQLARASGQIRFQDPSGNVVVTVETMPSGKPPSGVKSPVSDDELQRRRQFRDGKPLSEILKRFQDGQ